MICPPFLFVTGPTLYDGIIRLKIPSLRMLSLGRENFLTYFELYRILSVRTCNVDSSLAIAESLGLLKSLIRIIFFILLIT